jgi:ketosteroid isomerase-like protein
MTEPVDRPLAQTPEDLVRFFVERANAADVEGMVALYEADAVVAAGSPVASGHEQIRSFYKELLSRRSRFPPVEPLPALCNGDIAMTVTRLPKGRCSVEVARRQSDGSWRWILDQLKIEPLPEA